VPQQPQQYIAQQTASAGAAYAYQQPQPLTMAGGPAMGAGFSSHGAQTFAGYDDSANAYDAGQGALGGYASGPQGAYYHRSS